jgi:hypothetical protein
MKLVDQKAAVTDATPHEFKRNDATRLSRGSRREWC